MSEKDVEYSIDVVEHATAIYEMLQEGGDPDRATSILMMTLSMLFYNIVDDEGRGIDHNKAVASFAKKVKSVIAGAIENNVNPADIAYNSNCAGESLQQHSDEKRAPMVAMDITHKMATFQDASAALNILAAASAHILTTRFYKEEESVKAYNVFTDTIGKTVAASEKMGFASWVQGTAH
jgi:hypothetical protein